ncbi:DUF2278 family protein [Puia dinghuensis]|uniref:LTD domain-containing protein n=1 Tax=Puia dinghuensis TaxID=1792502 RepID=A0A8J2XWM9_9BACT|nr:DUF2278 family protein [Puia dinghuensis]GGB24983.1 hypothetical protein GCM10011511_56160 [Puia dinghuensis]
MPIKDYGVVQGRVFDRVLATKRNEHYHILVNRGDNPQRVAINTLSNEAPSQVLFYADLDFQHPITDAILQATLPSGYTALPSKPGGLALDFIRMNLFPIAQLKPLPPTSAGNSNDLNDQLDLTVQQALSDPDAVLYAFGQHWADTSGADKVFPEIAPSTGIHDIHMNQGNPKSSSFFKDNGVYQDGGLIFHFPSRNRWAAIFTAFQSESFHTDDQTGDPLVASSPVGAGSAQQPENLTPVRIAAALVNPAGGDPGKEYVLLLNKSSKPVDLSGWKIADAHKNKDTIGSQTMQAGDTLKVHLSGHGAQLSNKGGIITLLNAQGLKVDGVTYTRKDVEKEGELVNF